MYTTTALKINELRTWCDEGVMKCQWRHLTKLDTFFKESCMSLKTVSEDGP